MNVRAKNSIIFIALLCWTTCASDQAQAAALPLKVSASHRYFVDQEEKPFLVVGDTAWSIIAQSSRQDVEQYLDDRRKRGFNSIIVNLLEHKFCAHAPLNRAGQPPFATPGDFSTPNPEYFAFAHDVVQLANSNGIVAWLAPAYLGYGGGDEGFFREIKSGGKEKLRAYGRYLGNVFRDLPNIVWLLGGDFTPPPGDRWVVTELAESIHEMDRIHLMTAHNSPENSAASIYGAENWLAVDTVYSYEPALFRPVLAEYALKPPRPFVLIETTYEGEHNSTPEQIRRQAYWAMLGGACGQFLGNNPIWHFDGPGLFPSTLTWQQALDAAGSRDMARLSTFFGQLPWFELLPDESHSIVKEGYGQGTAATLTSRVADRTVVVTYVPSTGLEARELTIALSEFPGPVKARWVNPTSGVSIELPGSPFPNQGPKRVHTPGDNGTKSNDWLLLLSTKD